MIDTELVSVHSGALLQNNRTGRVDRSTIILPENLGILVTDLR